jgi:hypothetical protein
LQKEIHSMTNPPRAFAKRFFGVACLALFLSAGAAIAQVPTQITHPPNGIGESTIGHPAIANVPTTITHQGRLFDSGTPPTGTYDMQFKLYDTAMVGTGMLQGSPNTVTLPTVNVTNGIFTVQLDFGASAFPGADRFLEISVRHPGDASYTTLAPRTQLTAAPYAIRSLSAASADNATTATTATTATNNVLKSGDTMTGALVLSGDPTVALGAATKQYVDSGNALKLNLSGGTMTGQLVLSGNPTVALGAATKQYVDSGLSNLNGANLTAGSVTTDKLAPVYGYFYLSGPLVIPSGGSVPFAQTGPASGIVRSGINGTDFVLPDAGVYEITWQVPIAQAGALDLALNGTELPETVVGRDTGTTQIVGNVLINASASSVLNVRVPSSNPSALTTTFVVSGGSFVTGSLVIKRIK